MSNIKHDNAVHSFCNIEYKKKCLFFPFQNTKSHEKRTNKSFFFESQIPLFLAVLLKWRQDLEEWGWSFFWGVDVFSTCGRRDQPPPACRNPGWASRCAASPVEIKTSSDNKPSLRRALLLYFNDTRRTSNTAPSFWGVFFVFCFFFKSFEETARRKDFERSGKKNTKVRWITDK